MTTYKKIGEDEIAVIETVPAEIKLAYDLPEQVYSYDFLVQQKIDIQTQWDEQLVQKNKEIEEINTTQGEAKAKVELLLSEAFKLGIK